MPLQNYKTDHFLGELIKYTLCIGEKDRKIMQAQTANVCFWGGGEGVVSRQL